MRKLVLWGHGVDEYSEMFDLTPKDLQGRILEFGCGPSAVNALQTKAGCEVVSCDPLFALNKDSLFSETSLIFADRVKQIYAAQEQFDFRREGSFPKLIAKRQAGMEVFFADYEAGQAAGRYLSVCEGSLPFADFSFDHALCSHYFFSGGEDLDLAFHLQMIAELARVARDVRIFPLIDRNGQASQLLGPVLLGLQQQGYGVEVREVPYHFQTTGNAMLRVWAQTCELK